MPVPKLMARINRRVFNPREVRKGKRPVLIHQGRKSGQTFLTPLDAHPIDDGYLFILMYGSDSDWVQNILASQRATLRVADSEIGLVTPKVVDRSRAKAVLSPNTKMPPDFLKVSEFLTMDVA